LLFRHVCSDDDDVIQEENLEFDSGFGNIIVVDNLPVVPKEKFEKLVTVVRKIYSQIGAIKEDGLWMPVDPSTEKSLGYCFIEYNTPQVNRYSFLGRIQCLFYHRFDEVKLQWLF
jgi:translation initiation factor 3 subunit B